jgi:signal transduction histidine kinase
MFAQFLHDVVGPSLSVMGLQLDLLRMDYAETPALSLRLREIQSSMEKLMEQIRECANSLTESGTELLSAQRENPDGL